MIARSLLWLLLAAPLAFQAYRYLQEIVYYGEFLHWTGDQAVRLLIVTLAVTPLRLTFPTAGWARWLILHRRDLGLATFLYALVHTAVYVDYKSALATMIGEAGEPGMWTGWLALLVFLPLAITSNNASVRRLGTRWKLLHRTVYLAAGLTFAHWILTAFDPTMAVIHLSVLLAFFALRQYQVQRRRR